MDAALYFCFRNRDDEDEDMEEAIQKRRGRRKKKKKTGKVVKKEKEVVEEMKPPEEDYEQTGWEFILFCIFMCPDVLGYIYEWLINSVIFQTSARLE